MSKLEDLKALKEQNNKIIGQCVVNIKYNQDKLDRILPIQQDLIRKIQRLEMNQGGE